MIFGITRDPTLSKKFSLWNVYVKDMQNFIIEEEETKRIQGSDVIDLTARYGERVFRIKRITNMAKDAAESYMRDQKIKLESIFNPTPSPYFAVLTKEIECPKDFLPTYNESENSGNKVSYYILYANERFHYGVCSKDLIKYRVIVAFTYCKNTEDLYQLEYFVPDEDYDETGAELIESFSC